LAGQLTHSKNLDGSTSIVSLQSVLQKVNKVSRQEKSPSGAPILPKNNSLSESFNQDFIPNESHDA